MAKNATSKRTAQAAAGEDSEFQDWMNQVDAAFTARYGFSVHDMPDAPFASYFEDGMTPREAARAVRENGI